MRARTWCRVDLAGGTLDIWPLGLLHPGARTVSVAIDVATEAEILPLDAGYRVVQGDHVVEAADLATLRLQSGAELPALLAEATSLAPCELRLSSGSPQGAGLGASSALGSAIVLAALGEQRRARGEMSGLVVTHAEAHPIAAVVRDIEARLMGLPTGIQDHYAALLGGALVIEHRPGGAAVTRLDFDAETFSDALLVLYTGKTHVSAAANWQVVRRRLDGEAASVRRFAAIAEIAVAVPSALVAGDFARVGGLMSAEWAERRELAPEIPTPTIEALLEGAAARGAWGGKACGAGGGGCVAILAPAEAHEAIAALGERLGCRRLPARVAAGSAQLVS